MQRESNGSHDDESRGGKRQKVNSSNMEELQVMIEALTQKYATIEALTQEKDAAIEVLTQEKDAVIEALTQKNATLKESNWVYSKTSIATLLLLSDSSSLPVIHTGTDSLHVGPNTKAQAERHLLHYLSLMIPS
jgi:hypothetical protein